jgi:hypothetical protein
MWSFSVCRGEGKPQSHCNFWSWRNQCLTVVETQGSEHQVWGVMKEIQWTQEKTISWNWWCSLCTYSRDTQDWNKLYCTVVMAHTVALSFFQNPALDRESNHTCKSEPNLIFYSTKTVKRVQIIWCIWMQTTGILWSLLHYALDKVTFIFSSATQEFLHLFARWLRATEFEFVLHYALDIVTFIFSSATQEFIPHIQIRRKKQKLYRFIFNLGKYCKGSSVCELVQKH